MERKERKERKIQKKVRKESDGMIERGEEGKSSIANNAIFISELNVVENLLRHKYLNGRTKLEITIRNTGEHRHRMKWKREYINHSN